MTDKPIEWHVDWEAVVNLHQIGTHSEDPRVVSIAITYTIDGLQYVLTQKKDASYKPSYARTLFGGHVESGESCEGAAYREVGEELGTDFRDLIVKKSHKEFEPVCDVAKKTTEDQSRSWRLYAIELGDYSYLEWLNIQSKIVLGEGIGFEGMTYDELKSSYMGERFKPHDRDMAGYILASQQ